jgi:hypothetical protein
MIGKAGPPRQRMAFRWLPGWSRLNMLSQHVVCMDRLETTHQAFKRLLPTMYWPKVLVQFAEKHNMRVAFEVAEGTHVNWTAELADGASIEEFVATPGQPMYQMVLQHSASSQTTGVI